MKPVNSKQLYNKRIMNAIYIFRVLCAYKCGPLTKNWNWKFHTDLLKILTEVCIH